MKKIERLVVIEADETLEHLLPRFTPIVEPFSERPVSEMTLPDALDSSLEQETQLVLFHSNLTSLDHLRRFVDLRQTFPYSTVVIVSAKRDEEICLLALEAGAEDSVVEEALDFYYLRKLALLSRRRFDTEVAMRQYREQLLACIENTPNVAVQWYNGRGEVLFWNKASEVLFGCSAREAVGKHVNRLIVVPDDRKFWLRRMMDVLRTGNPVEVEEWHFARADGSLGYCRSTLFNIPSFEPDPWFVCMDVDITSHRNAEEALRLSEENYAALFNQASDAIFLNTLDGQILHVNQRGCDLLGHSLEQLKTMRVDDLYRPEELSRLPIMRQELASGQRTSVERNILRADGTTVPVDITAQRLHDGRVMAIVRDISERRKAEEAIRQSEAKYRLLVEQLADGITIFDEAGRILDVNGSGLQLLGYTKEELLSKNITDINTDMALDPVSFDRLQRGEATIKQRTMRRKDGSMVVTEVHTKRLWDGLYLSSVRDLTERLEAQRQLEKEKALSDSLINNLPGLFYLFRKDGVFLRWNKQLETVSGYTADEISRMSPLDFFVSDEVYDVFHTIEQVFANGSAHIEAFLLTKDHQRIPYYFSGTAIKYDGDDCSMGTAIDLSDLKNLEKELADQKIAGQKKIMQAMIEAEENEKAKLGSELHDNVNQILSVVRMYLSILASGQEMEEVTLPKAIDLLNSAIEEIRTLSHRLAVGYRFETGLSSALEEMVDKLRPTRDFSIHLSLAPDLDRRTSREQKLAIYRIVQEQLANIARHAKASRVDIRVHLQREAIEVDIADDGRGFQLARVKKGLGLNNITNRAEALEGKVSIHTQPGKGCRLHVLMPLREGAND